MCSFVRATHRHLFHSSASRKSRAFRVIYRVREPTCCWAIHISPHRSDSPISPSSKPNAPNREDDAHFSAMFVLRPAHIPKWHETHKHGSWNAPTAACNAAGIVAWWEMGAKRMLMVMLMVMVCFCVFVCHFAGFAAWKFTTRLRLAFMSGKSVCVLCAFVMDDAIDRCGHQSGLNE